jgi:hypothetical protein
MIGLYDGDAPCYDRVMPVFRTQPLPAGAFTQGLSATVDATGVLEGQAAPGAIIEVNNLSTLPAGDGVVEDGVEVARAGVDGRFSASVTGAAAGDVLQVQVRVPGQPIHTAVQVRVDAGRTAFDPRAAMVRPERLRFEAQPDGTTRIEARTRQPVTEPDAVIRFTNARTGATVDVKADVMGRVGATAIDARVGDRIDVAVSDGTGNLDFSVVAGSVSVVGRGPMVQPAPLMKDGGYVKLLPLNGPLFLEGGPGYARQGSIGNCPVPAACVALAAVDEAAVRDLIRDNGDGTFTVTFHPPGKAPVEVVVDHQVWGNGSKPKYGTADTDPKTGLIERWFPLVEKAYAAYVGDYEILGKGSSVGTVLSELTGRQTREVWTNTNSVDAVWSEALRGAQNKLPMAAGTYGSDKAALYRGTGVYANHAYSILGVEEVGGRRLMTLRNPWGTGAPPGNGVNNGEFQMAVEDFCRLFQVLNVS